MLQTFLKRLALAGVLALGLASLAPAAVTVEKIPYRGWPNSYKISNGTVELIVTADVGPRIIFYGFVNGENEFHEFGDEVGKTGGDKWLSYGGGRLWVAPEAPRTYFPDNVPVKVVREGGLVKFIAPVELHPLTTHLQREVDIELAPTGTEVTIISKITNHGAASTTLSPWFITVMAQKGRAILPFVPKAPWGPHTLSTVGAMALWSYTDFTDPRWVIGSRYIQLKQDPNPTGALKSQKIGLHNPAGWGAYYRNGDLFVKRTKFDPHAQYPDYGSNFETYTEAAFLELESLGPEAPLAPGATVRHVEKWWLFKNVPAGNNDAWVEKSILPLVEQTKF